MWNLEWVIHLSFEKQDSPSQKFTTGNRKVSKKVKRVQTPPIHIILHPPFLYSRGHSNWATLIATAMSELPK
jgi:hypothetical protein